MIYAPTGYLEKLNALNKILQYGTFVKHITHIVQCVVLFGGFNTNWDGHHDGGVVSRGGQFPLSANALSGWVFLNNLH